ncbi:isocyanide synthase family protein [Streptomyces luteireticuli]|uniref:Paerucumarin biosynthesis protein PvcA n=1 Tax=Streptomyces luteireticuli TaxID=173858 RepID=A0ABN0YL39_9ACTN
MTQATKPSIATEILDYVFQYRRLIPGADADCGGNTPCAECMAPQQAKLEKFIQAGEPIHFVLPAFPAKSPNIHKVLGELPDLAERLALEFLQSFCDHLGHYYAPGARVTVCSDGHTFADVVGVSDEAATRYRDELERVVDTLGADAIGFYSLQDAFDSTDYPAVRRTLLEKYAESLEDLRGRAAGDEGLKVMFNGMHRFMFEDQIAVRQDASRNRVREDAKVLAWQVIRHSNAWSRLVADEFPDALRLSIHPQHPHSEKIGLHLMRTGNPWLTPWHGVALEVADGMLLTKRSHAEELNASLVWRNDRPSHFVAPHLTVQQVMA